MHPHTPKGHYRFFITLWWSHVKHDGSGFCLFMYFMHRDDECKWGVQQQISCTISWYSQKLTGSDSCFDILCVFLLSADPRQAEVKLCFQICSIFILFIIQEGHVALCLSDLYYLSGQPGSNDYFLMHVSQLITSYLFTTSLFQFLQSENDIFPENDCPNLFSSVTRRV